MVKKVLLVLVVVVVAFLGFVATRPSEFTSITSVPISKWNDENVSWYGAWPCQPAATGTGPAASTDGAMAAVVGGRAVTGVVVTGGGGPSADEPAHAAIRISPPSVSACLPRMPPA